MKKTYYPITLRACSDVKHREHRWYVDKYYLERLVVAQTALLLRPIHTIKRSLGRLHGKRFSVVDPESESAPLS